MDKYIYLDTAATTKPKKEVIDAMIPYLTDKWYNPSSLYNYGKDVRNDVEYAREIIAKFINAKPNEIYFTSGASESNNWAIQGFVNNTYKNGKTPCIITSCIEHKSIDLCIEGIRTPYIKTAYVEVDKHGLIKMNAIQELMRDYFCCTDYAESLVSIQFANNEIGTIQDIKKISDLVHKYHGIFHTDATQAIGKIPIDVKKLGIDMMSASGHKLGCVKGIGFLYIKNGINISPLIYGSQERGLRGGTENTAGIIGLAKAIELCNNDWSFDRYAKEYSKLNFFRNCLENKLNCKINGCFNSTLPNIINATFPQNIMGESLLYTLDLSGVQVSTGSACNSLSVVPSYVLEAIGLTDEEAMRTVRFTLSDDITYEDISYVIDEISKAIKIITM